MVYKVESICCMSLPVAGLVFGYLGVIGSLLIALSKIKVFFVFDDTFDDFYYSPEFIFLQIFACIVNAIACVLLIVGTKKRSHRMLLPWLIIKVIIMAVFTSLCLYILVMSIIDIKDTLAPVVIIFSLLGLCMVGYGVYVWIGIFSLYHVLRDQGKGETPMDAERLNS